MPWSTITAAQFIAKGFTTDERTRLQTAAGGDDGLTEILTGAISEWRGVIAAAGHAIDEGDTTTVPESCHRHLIAQARWALLIKFPKLGLQQSEERKAAADKAEDFLQRIADGDQPIESPEVPAADVTPGPNFGTRTRNYDRNDQDGI